MYSAAIANIKRMFLVCVFVGLFFSSGEGIQLLPFPDDNAIDKLAALDLGSSKGDYSFGVKNLGSNISSSKIRTRKLHDPPRSTAPSLLASCQFPEDPLAYLRRGFNPCCHASAILLSEVSDRAPPLE